MPTPPSFPAFSWMNLGGHVNEHDNAEQSARLSFCAAAREPFDPKRSADAGYGLCAVD